MTATSLRSQRRVRGAAFLLAALGCGGSDLIAPSTGGLQVTAATSGNPADLDQDGYTVTLDGGAGQALPVNGSVAFTQLAASTHTVALSGVSPNCTVSGQNPARVTVTAGATAHSVFQIACAPSLVLTGRIAFGSDRDGNPEIYAMNANGTGVTRLTTNGANDAQPAWSPGGTRIAFGSDRDGNAEIYAMNADGSGVARLTNNPGFDGAPAWSPDGSRIAFESTRDGNPGIYVMNADGSGVARLTDNSMVDASPTWAPDGTQIAFLNRVRLIGRAFGTAIDVVKADGSSVTLLSILGGPARRLAWSPDGTRIAADRDLGDREIFVVSVDGSGNATLTNNPATDAQPGWSPDGTKIAFASDRDGNFEIYVMNADGSNPTRLTNHTAGDFEPAWAP